MEIKIQQALFGYDGGHQLLAASTRLPIEAKHYLAVATDLSGSVPTSGFDRAYSGMPVPGTEFYALFCTWLAPEMPRPGCVWSHVMLIELADLAQIVDLGELRALFRRPLKVDEQTWRDPLPFIPLHTTASPVKRSQEPECVRFLEMLYSTPQTPAVVEAPSAVIHEELLFAIWSQQWPRLRRSFRFSTGSFADRGRSGPAFDLQVTPTGNLSAWQRSGQTNQSESANPASVVPEPVSRKWLGVAAQDLFAPDSQGFRSFLHTHGLDVSDPRGAFVRLATAYELVVLQPRGDWAERLRSIGLMFPSQSEALRLKASLLTPQQDWGSDENVEHAWATACFLISASEAAAYTDVSFDHAGLAPLLWKERREEVISLLARQVRQKESPAASSFAKAVANSLQPCDLQFISARQSELIPVMLSHRPALAFDAETWRLPAHIQSQIYDVLDRLRLGQKDWAEILGAMFIAATHISVREVVERAGSLAMNGAFRWLEHGLSQEYLPSQGWREALADPAKKLLTSSEPLSPAPLALCAWCVSSETARHVLSASRQDIQQLAEQPIETLPSPLRVPTACLLMALGLMATDGTGSRLILRSFYFVHDVLAAGNYSSESWRLLSPELPYLGWWRDWDRCEKLRRAVRGWVSKHAKSGNPLLEAADTPERRELARQVVGADTESDEFLD